jgi:DNA polymerase III epsilon subunit family exonuclease
MSLFSLFSQSIAKENYIFFDVETTGLFPLAGDRILELAMVKVSNGEIVDRIDTLINPCMKIPEQVINIHFITDDMVKDSPVFDLDMCNRITGFVGNFIIVAHNAAFDLGFLSSEFARNGVFYEGWQAIDTLKIANAIFPGQKHRLENLLKNYNIVPEGDLHRAITDTMALKKLFFELLDETEIRGKTLEQLVKKYGFEGNILPRNFPARIREALVEKKIISGKYRKRDNAEIDLAVVPLAPVWVDRRWYFMGKEVKSKKILSLHAESFIEFYD